MLRELSAAELAWRCPPEWLPWTSSSEVAPATSIVGQERAVEAIAFGLGMRGIGFNVFVTGLSGTGRLTTIKQLLDQLADGRVPDDVCYVHNFRNPSEPKALFVVAGAGRRLRDGLEATLRELATSIPGLLSDKEVRRRLERAVGELQQQERSLVETFETGLKAAGFTLVQMQTAEATRPELLPLVDGKPVPFDELAGAVEQKTIAQEEAERLRGLHPELSEQMHELFQRLAELRRQMQTRAQEVRNDLVAPVLGSAITRLRDAVADGRADDYLEALRAELAEHLELFAPDGEESGDGDRFQPFRVNLVVDNADTTSRPVILETEPTYSNLFGTIERTLTSGGDSESNFLRIRAGSLLAANGGFLVLNADDLLMEPRVWPGLKRALKFRRAQIQSPETQAFGAVALKPEPVPIEVKVVVIGDRGIYDYLYRNDADFPKIFKALADFDSVIVPSAESARAVLSVLRKVSDQEGLPPMDASGMAAMLEHAVAYGHWRHRFSSRFSDLADLLREAAWVADREGSTALTRLHVVAADAAYRRRHSLSEERSREYILEGLVRVDSEGSAVGEVNGLAVYDLAHHRFGKPTRITARVGLGREGVVNVERQAGLSGPTHDKGVNILAGYLRGTFAKRSPLTMTCSVTFEQSYGGIDGDSASSTEVYAILSALAELPIRQDVAVTGSVDQLGRVQTIGGVNEKVEGFFAVCQARGLTGSQGVMIPFANVADLHLADEVVAAVAASRFHVWAVDRVEDGIALLTGVPAGTWLGEAGWTADSVYGRCQKRLDEMARLMRQSGKEPNGEGNAEKGTGKGPTETAVTTQAREL